MHQGSIYTLDWSLSGKLMASGSNDKMIKLINFDEELNVKKYNSVNQRVA